MWSRRNIFLIVSAVVLIPILLWSFSWKRPVSVELDAFWRQGLIFKVESGKSGDLARILKNKKLDFGGANNDWLNFFCTQQKFITYKDCQQRIENLGGGDGLGWTYLINGRAVIFQSQKKSFWGDWLSFKPQIWRAYFRPQIVNSEVATQVWRYRQYEIALSEKIEAKQVKNLVEWLNWQDTLNLISNDVTLKGYINLSRLSFEQKWWPQLDLMLGKIQGENAGSARILAWRASLNQKDWTWQILKNSVTEKAALPQCAGTDPILERAESGWRWCQKDLSQGILELAPYWLAWYPEARARWQNLQNQTAFYQLDLMSYAAWLRQPLCAWILNPNNEENSQALNFNSKTIYLINFSQAQSDWGARLDKDWQRWLSLNQPQIKTVTLPDRTLMREIIPTERETEIKTKTLSNGEILKTLESVDQSWNLNYIQKESRLSLSNNAQWLEDLALVKPAAETWLKDSNANCATGKFSDNWQKNIGWNFWQLSDDEQSWVLKLW